MRLTRLNNFSTLLDMKFQLSFYPTQFLSPLCMYSLFKSSKGLLLQNFCQTCLVLLMNSGVKVTCPKYTVSSSKKSWKKNVFFKSNQRLSVNFIIWTYRVRQIFVAEIICLIKTVIFSSIARKKFPFLSVFTIKINIILVLHFFSSWTCA